MPPLVESGGGKGHRPRSLHWPKQSRIRLQIDYEKYPGKRKPWICKPGKALTNGVYKGGCSGEKPKTQRQ